VTIVQVGGARGAGLGDSPRDARRLGLWVFATPGAYNEELGVPARALEIVSMKLRRDPIPPDRALQARMTAALLAAGGLAAEAEARGRGTPARTQPIEPRDERRAIGIRRTASLPGGASALDPRPPRSHRESR
jgi:hypothetical protein